MIFNAPTWAIVALTAIGSALSVPVLAKGFSRRGKGVVYESNFLIQRAPQLMSGVNVALIVVSFFHSEQNHSHLTNGCPPADTYS